MSFRLERHAQSVGGFMAITPSIEGHRTTSLVAGVLAVCFVSWWITGVVLGEPSSNESDCSDHLFIGHTNGSGWVVTVSESESEPRSIGSYAIRLYIPLDPEWPFDSFVDGDVLPRDGVVEALIYDDINADGVEDAIVVMRSVGSGGYLSADGFILSNEGLGPPIHVDGITERSDLVQELRNLLKKDR